MLSRIFVLILAPAALLAGLVGCSENAEPIGSGELAGINVRMAQSPGAESQVLTALYAEAYTAAGAAVEIRTSGTPDAVLQSVTDGQTDVAVDFAGRLYADVLGIAVDPDRPPERVDVARAVTDGLSPRGVSTLNRGPYNAVDRVICSRETLRRVDATNLSELATAIRPVKYASGADQRSDDGELARLARAYPGLFKEPTGVEPGGQFAAVNEGRADCALGPAGAPQIARFELLPLVDDKATTSPNQAIVIANTEFVLSAPDAFATLTNRVTRLITDERVRQWNSAVQFEGVEPAAVAREVLTGADLIG